MPKVTFLHDKITIDIPSGTTVQVAVEMAGATLPFGCRMGSCGTCRCLVVTGTQNVNEKTDAELDLFDTLTFVGDNERLGCQLVIMGDVEIQS
jgi:ferredoxin